MTAFVLSLVRTLVPIIVGSLLSFLTTLGLNIDTPGVEGLTVFLTGLFIGIYYLLIRLIEQKFPNAGYLLGSNKTPDTYSKGNELTTQNDAVNPLVYEQPNLWEGTRKNE